jgi:hypothetical protein
MEWHYWVTLFRYLFSTYVGVWVVIWNLIALLTLYGVFSKSKTRVDPYNSDNAGGLSFVGTYILNVSRLGLIASPYLAAELLPAVRAGHGTLGQFSFWLLLITIPTQLIIAMFIPLSACRHAMIEAKNEFLNPISNKIFDYIKLTHHSEPISKSQLEELTALIDFQMRLRKDFPTWPIDVSMFRQIGVNLLLVLLPAIYTLIQVIQLLSRSPSK